MITAINARENYRVELDNGQQTIASDVASDKGGSGTGLRPHELLEAAYAACLNISVRMILDRLELAYTAVTVRVRLDRATPGATVFEYGIEIEGALSEAEKQRVLTLAANCPVRKTLSGRMEFRPLSK